MIALVPLVFLSISAPAATLRVGPSEQYAAPCAALADANDGDVIEIDAAGVYRGDTCAIYRSNLTIRGANGRPKIDADGRSAEGKGIWVIKGNNTRVENIEFTGAAVPDRNGAAIRQEGANLTVRNCWFHHNENGILTGGSAGSEILIEYSEFGDNGYGDGYSHNMYINHVAKFTLRFSYSHHSREGHLVKSRAGENHILYNRLSDEATGTGSYEIDLPNGGKSYIIGNVIQQGPETHNSVLLNYRGEGPHPDNPSTELFVINNTFVNERTGGSSTFIRIDPSVTTPGVIRNNIFAGPGTVNTQAGSVFSENITGADLRFLDPANYEYRLRAGSPAVDRGADPGAPLTPGFAYVHPACGEGRQTVNSIDAGAFESGGGAFNADAPARCRKVDAGGVVNAADFSSGPVAPGSIVSIFGSNLASEAVQAEKVPLPVDLRGTSVTVNGVAAPLFYASPSQINAQVPFETQPGLAAVTVNASGIHTEAATVEVVASAPVIFVWSEGRAIVQNQDLTLNTPQNPAASGSVITAYLTGQGSVTPRVPTGGTAPEQPPLAIPDAPYSAIIGGQSARVGFLGLTPQLVGLLQANITVPMMSSPGDYPLIVIIGGAAARPAAVSIK